MKNKEILAWLGKYGPSIHIYVRGEYLVAHDGKEWVGNLSLEPNPLKLGDPWQE